MDIKGLMEGEWLEIQMRSGLLKLKVRFVGQDERLDVVKFYEDIDKKFRATEDQSEQLSLIKQLASRVGDYISDWNLQTGEESIPCTSENKKEYLHIFMFEKLEGSEDRVFTKLINFATDVQNFLKN